MPAIIITLVVALGVVGLQKWKTHEHAHDPAPITTQIQACPPHSHDSVK